jgi:hypothetical protein
VVITVALSALLVILAWALVLRPYGAVSLCQLGIPLLATLFLFLLLHPLPKGMPEDLRVEYTVRAMRAFHESDDPSQSQMSSSSAGYDGWGNPLVVTKFEGREFIISYGSCGKRDVPEVRDYYQRKYVDPCDDIVMIDGEIRVGPAPFVVLAPAEPGP